MGILRALVYEVVGTQRHGVGGFQHLHALNMKLEVAMPRNKPTEPRAALPTALDLREMPARMLQEMQALCSAPPP